MRRVVRFHLGPIQSGTMVRSFEQGSTDQDEPPIAFYSFLQLYKDIKPRGPISKSRFHLDKIFIYEYYI